MGVYEGDIEPSKVYPGAPGSMRLRLANLGSFVLCAAINALGSTGKLSSDGEGVGGISAKYTTRITPAGYAFSIWGVIYTLLAIFSIWQLLPGQRAFNTIIDEQIRWLFVASNCFNALWIAIFVQGTLAAVWISSVILFVLLGTLLAIMVRAELWQKPRATYAEMVAVDIAFSIYAGWTTAASILNVALSLSGSGWRGSSGFGEDDWSALMGAIAAIIYLTVVVRRKDGVYGLVYCWAAVAIVHKNSGSDAIMITYYVCAAIVGVVSLIALYMGHTARDSYETLA